MSKEILTFGGVVTDKMPSSRFKVILDDNNLEITAIISGKIRKNNIRIYVGDKVDVEMSPYDLTVGRISYRYK